MWVLGVAILFLALAGGVGLRVPIYNRTAVLTRGTEASRGVGGGGGGGGGSRQRVRMMAGRKYN